jgi:membrane-associated protease RseP (regulator of RpoE activity)
MTTTMNQELNTDLITSVVGRFMKIDDITSGGPKQNALMRFRGHLLNANTAEAYDQMTEALKPFNVAPLFRWDTGQHAVLLVPAWRKPGASNYWINIGLFILTLLSVLLAGALYTATSDPFANGVNLGSILEWLKSGWPFAVSMLAILVTHEFGHYLAGRYHNTLVTLPYFIPFPFSPFGTMGAFISMKEPPKNRRILLDIGIAGPLAGLVVAIPVLLYGLSISKVGPLPVSVARAAGLQLEGNSLLYLLSKFAVFHQVLPHPITYGAVPPLLYWLRYFFTGQPLPLGGFDVNLSPVAWAGWAGLLVTSLNLVPAGQLDGGHMLYVLLGSKGARRVLPLILVALVVLGFFWSGWWLWAALIFFLGRVYAEPLDQITPLDGRRKALAVLALIIFLLVFTPVPLILVAG